MYKVTITQLGKTTEQTFDNITEASFTILNVHANARAIGLIQGQQYEVQLDEVA